VRRDVTHRNPSAITKAPNGNLKALGEVYTIDRDYDDGGQDKAFAAAHPYIGLKGRSYTA